MLLVVVLVSFGVNYLSSALFEAFWPAPPAWWAHGAAAWRWIQVGLSVFVLLVVIAVSLSFVIAWQVRQARHVDILLPIVVSTQRVRVPSLHGYDVTRRARQALGHVNWEHSDGETIFRRAWRQGRGAGGRPLRGFALSCIYDLVEYALLTYIGRYGRETLGRQADFLPGADLVDRGSSHEKYRFPQLGGRLPVGNYFFQHDKQFTQRKFRLPSTVKLGASPLPKEGLVAEDGDRSVRQLWLKGRYGTLTISPSQNWRRASRHRQAARVLQKHFPGGPNTEVWGVFVRLALESRFRVWAFLWPPARTQLRHQVTWLTGLADYIERRADWSRFIATEKDRALVRMEEKLDRLLAMEREADESSKEDHSGST